MAETNNKKRLLAGLEQQVVNMIENADLLAKVCPERGHDVELRGAAKITQTWIDGIKNEQ